MSLAVPLARLSRKNGALCWKIYQIHMKERKMES